MRPKKRRALPWGEGLSLAIVRALQRSRGPILCANNREQPVSPIGMHRDQAISDLRGNIHSL